MKKDAILERFTRNSQSEQPEDCSHSRTAERLFPTNKETSKIISGVCPSYPIPPWRLSTPPYKNTTLSIFTFYASFCKRLRLVFGDCNLYGGRLHLSPREDYPEPLFLVLLYAVLFRNVVFKILHYDRVVGQLA